MGILSPLLLVLGHPSPNYQNHKTQSFKWTLNIKFSPKLLIFTSCPLSQISSWLHTAPATNHPQIFPLNLPPRKLQGKQVQLAQPHKLFLYCLHFPSPKWSCRPWTSNETVYSSPPWPKFHFPWVLNKDDRMSAESNQRKGMSNNPTSSNQVIKQKGRNEGLSSRLSMATMVLTGFIFFLLSLPLTKTPLEYISKGSLPPWSIHLYGHWVIPERNTMSQQSKLIIRLTWPIRIYPLNLPQIPPFPP